MRENIPAPTLLQTVAASLLVNLIPLACSLQVRSYDAQTHLFFADHYLRGWFNGWEPRWFGGLFVYSYPPLTHQLIALVGHVLGLETAWCVVAAGVVAAVPLSVWLLTDALVDREAAGWAAAFSVATAGVYTTLYTFGQLPTLLGLVLIMAAAAGFVRYVVAGHTTDLVASTALGAASVAAHHLTGIVGIVMLDATCLLHLVLRDWASEGEARSKAAGQLGRVGMACACLGVAALLTLTPFLWWMSHWRVPQAEIPHITRENIFADPVYRYVFCIAEWGAAPLGLLAAIRLCFRQREMLAWVLLVGLLAVLSLGPHMTRLPGLMFPHWAYWLTYERFALWGAVFILVPFGAWLRTVAFADNGAGSRLRSRALVLGLLAIFGAFAVSAATYEARTPLLTGLPDRALLPRLASFVDAFCGGPQCRYLTIGLQDADMAQLSRLVSAQTIDGTYFTARSDPRLSRSGVATLDTIEWQAPALLGVLRFILSHPQEYGLQMAICGTPSGSRLLHTVGWRCLGRMTESGLSYCRPGTEAIEGVTIWRRPAHLADVEQTPPPDDPLGLRILWGVCPLAFLTFGIAATASAMESRRRNR